MACGQDVQSTKKTDDASETSGSDGTDATDGTSAGDGTDATDGADDGTDGGVPTCQFAIPTWWKCNPWPNCPESGCNKGEFCTLIPSTPPRVECTEKGTAGPGQSCDHETGTFCKTGLCVEKECRSWCNDNSDCASSACQAIGKGPYSEVLACGSAQSACDPFKPLAGCENNMVCFYQQNTELGVCMDQQQKNKAGSPCDCTNCCEPGAACIVSDGEQFCAKLCAPDGGEGPSCQETCDEGQNNKTIGTGINACISTSGGGNNGGPDPIPCDILKQDCEGAAQACYSTNKGDQCLAKGNKPKGGACENANDCAPGTTCVANKCKAVCDPNKKLNNENCDVTQFQCTKLNGSTGGYCDE